jgi:hypothetical protein
MRQEKPPNFYSICFMFFFSFFFVKEKEAKSQGRTPTLATIAHKPAPD